MKKLMTICAMLTFMASGAAMADDSWSLSIYGSDDGISKAQSEYLSKINFHKMLCTLGQGQFSSSVTFPMSCNNDENGHWVCSVFGVVTCIKH